MEQIKVASPNDERIILILSEFRNHRSEDELRKLYIAAAKQGYQIHYIEQNNEICAIIGFRILTFLYNGSTLKVDDLYTHPSYRKMGMADRLFDHVIEIAVNNNCESLVLDTGFQRHDAHRFYLGKGLQMSSFHLSKNLKR